ncbi:hypothetical protein [Paenirhodobacter populi]|uniref:Relaxase n=1 Tax=Paenirhodobacter populi TaxID=2306993 RepID=A0A443J7M1_9RHOB|nr:hypothetical protein [Sinirhodobacter populi]RWR16494.1 hypothetical protein D2T30_21480 [Sinirhodobacter populi]
MRAHSRSYPDASFLDAYDFRPGAELIGGTVPYDRPAELRRSFERLAGDQGLLHITLSLPAGLRADRDLWTRTILTQLGQMDLPPYATPWITARHTDAHCDHIHVAVALRCFD